MLHSYVTDMAARVTPNTQIPKILAAVLILGLYLDTVYRILYLGILWAQRF